jgi:peptidoglycan hydrolase CwlO-like protein
MEKELRNLTSTLLGKSLVEMQEKIHIHQEELLMQNEELKRTVAEQNKILIDLQDKFDETKCQVQELEFQVRGLEALIAEADKKEENGK